MKSLIIAEKPSVATDLARVLARAPGMGKFEKKGEGREHYFENESAIIASAVGHLVEQRLPTLPDGRSLPWKFEVLPVIPDKFELDPIEGSKTKLNQLIRLMKRRDVVELINACDAGREGELIFRYLVDYAGVAKTVRRMWMQSMTDGSILEAWDHLREDEEMRPLADAAVCRSESDWLVGINATRALTAYNSKYGGFNKTPVGRVQTPTLALMAEREREISSFLPRDYWEVSAQFRVQNGEYRGLWIDQSFKKPDENTLPSSEGGAGLAVEGKHARPSRLWTVEEAEAIAERCRDKTASLEEKKKPQRQIAPQLYDLTTLQREANSRLGYSARRTLQLAQRLYETHKALTYPRTDSRYLPQDYLVTVKETFTAISSATAGVLSDLPEHATHAREKEYLRADRRIFNDAKVSDHFAIIPTGKFPSRLDDFEQKLYDLVCRRFVAAFYPHAEFELTTRLSRIGQDCFKTDGKVLVEPGWLAVYGRRAGVPGRGGDTDELVSLSAAENQAAVISVEVEAGQTRPPARYNESTLLSAMETAGKRVEEDELREAMAERGLGTPATRAAVIEGLIQDKYVVRDGRDFYVNTRGLRLIEQLNEMGIDLLASPEMTGEWEHKLREMAQGRLARPSFMSEIKSLTTSIVDRAKQAATQAVQREYPPFPVACPNCGAAQLGQDEGRYKCQEPDCKFSLPKVIAQRPLSESEVRELLEKKFVGPLSGFLSRFKQPFDAALELREDKSGTLKHDFIFEKSAQEEEELEAIGVPEHKLCACSGCEGGVIYETPHSYLCDRRANGGTKVCKARLAKEYCKVQITRDQAIKFFQEGRTDLYENFISKKGRPFKAYLVAAPKGKRFVNFEFPPREGGATKKVSKKVAPGAVAVKKKATTKVVKKKAATKRAGGG
jgi:DNA topoisomerase III